jgi:hypothetical protein
MENTSEVQVGSFFSFGYLLLKIRPKSKIADYPANSRVLAPCSFLDQLLSGVIVSSVTITWVGARVGSSTTGNRVGTGVGVGDGNGVAVSVGNRVAVGVGESVSRTEGVGEISGRSDAAAVGVGVVEVGDGVRIGCISEMPSSSNQQPKLVTPSGSWLAVSTRKRSQMV